MRLDSSQIHTFQLDGFLTGLPLLSTEACTQFMRQADKFAQDYPEAIHWAFDIKANLLFDWVYEIGVTPVLLDVIEDLIGPDMLLTNSIFRIKPPGSETRYGWHQDAARILITDVSHDAAHETGILFLN